jgi:signal transduction histidine kinase
VESFVAMAVAELQAAKTLSRAELIGTLPRLLAELARALENGAIEATAEEIGLIGLEHGSVRALQGVYSLRDLLTEYRIIRRVVRTALRAEGALAVQLEDVVSDWLDQAMGYSAGELGRLRCEGELAQTARASERHRLDMIFKASPAAMALWRGPQMVFELVNPAYQALFPGRALLGRPFLEALPEFKGQPFFEVFSHVLKTGEPFVGREVLARHRSTADGPLEDHYYDFTYVRIDDLEGVPYGVYDHSIDVTERILARRSLEESRQTLQQTVSDLERVRELRERFVATISHDLRTPLSAARITAQLMERRAEDPDAVRKSAGRIADNLDRADRMIRDLLDASRLNAGETLPLQLEPCDLGQIAANTLEELSTVHGDRFVLRTEGELEGVWSRSALRRILENLCGNAIKYGAPDLPIHVAVLRSEQSVRLRVHNSGLPIPPAELAHLFEPFRRTDTARRAGQTGWGLGLTLVKGLAESLGGRVGVESSAAHGTAFEVTLPLAPVEAAAPR